MNKLVSVPVFSDAAYSQLERLVADRVAAARGPLFTTDAADLFDAYLAGIGTDMQHYNCHACRRFVERYGGLVTISDNGRTVSPFWDVESPPDFFQMSLWGLCQMVYRAKVTGVFLSSDAVWGTPQTGAWTHLSGRPAVTFANPLKNAAQAMAAAREEYGMLRHGLADFPEAAVVQAVRVLEADAVDRSEKTLGVAKWLLALHARIRDVKGPARDNLVWLAVATAPPGWCHVRSTMISTLLDDIIAGLPYESIAKRWADKMHPLQYQRPTTLKEGALKAANEVVAKLGSEGALARRFARLSDVLAPRWLPRELPAAEKPKGGAFDHLRQRTGEIKPLDLPAQKMPWPHFRDAVLPTALKIAYLTPRGPAAFFGLVTAANPDAPPIIQWDGLVERDSDPHGMATPLPRNPVSWYFYHLGSLAGGWNLPAGEWVTVTAVFRKPCHWQKPDGFTHHSDAAFLALLGCWDTRHSKGGGFFPEQLRSEYHGIRAAMEAHAQAAPIAGKETATANGIALDANLTEPLALRVTAMYGVVQAYLVSWQ